MNEITLGAGCFWGVQAVYELLEGIKSTSVGYCGGKTQNPSYEAVCSKTTGHYEVVHIQYSPEIISLTDILKLFFFIHDPTQGDGQANDIGPQYLSVIFAPSKEHQEISNYLKQIQLNYREAIKTQLKAPAAFYTAEEYHQLYLNKNPTGYCHINMIKVKEFLETHQYSLK